MIKNNLIKYAVRCAALGALSTSAVHVSATDYNDPYWTNPEVNSDFVDNFNQTQIDRSKWLVETNIFVNGEDIDYQDVEYPQADWTIGVGQDDPAAIDGKALILKARYMDGEVQDYYGGDPANPGKPLFIRSGRIESQITDDTTFTYGKFEARLKMPPARNGEFPAWWLLGNFPDVGWTACQELDIMEFTGNNGMNIPQTYWTAPYAVHGGTTVGLAGLGITNPQEQYVTYGIIKTPSKVEWYINGVLTNTFSRDNQGDDQPWPYVTPMRMILNHAITHVEWPDVGNYNAYSPDANRPSATGWSYVDNNGVTQYEYIDVDAMNANIGRAGTDFVVDYVAHWPLPTSDAEHKYVDDSKSSFFRESGNTKGFYNLKGWLAPVSVTADGFDQPGWDTDVRDNGADNAADGYVGSKWATPNDDGIHWVEVDYGQDKQINYLWLEWAWNLPADYDIYGKSSTGAWEFITSSQQEVATWATHVFDVNRTYRYLKLVTKGRIDKSSPIWLLELMAFEDVPNMYPKPAGTTMPNRSVNVLNNGNFSQGLDSWGTEAFDGANPTYNVQNGAAVIALTNDGGLSGSVQLHTSGFGLKRDYRYHISFDARADVARNLMVRLAENNLNPSAAGTYHVETVAVGTSFNTYSFTYDYTGQGEPARLAFLLGGMGTATTYIDNVVIREGDFIGSGEPLVAAISSTNFVSASNGWETEWWGAPARAVDGNLGNKASGNDGEAEGMDLDITVRIDEHYDVRAVLVAGDNSPERSLDQFRVEFGNGTPLMGWTDSTTEGVYEEFANFNNTPAAGERDFKFFFRPPAGQLVEVADVQLLAVDLMPHRISAIALDEGGTISPAGTTRYSRNNTDDATYTFTAPQGQSVSNVIVDGVSMGPLNSYTFTDINADHTLAVSFGGEVEQPETGDAINYAPEAYATASSELQTAALANDGDAGSRWESEHGAGPSWLALELNDTVRVSKVVIDWEAANAGTYEIQGSLNGIDWNTLEVVSGGAFGNRTDTVLLDGSASNSVNHIRIYGVERSAGNNWGYSIFNVEVWGEAGDTSMEEEVEIEPVSAAASSDFQAAANAIDADAGSRWESAHADATAHLTLDLASTYKLVSVAIDWEAANAGAYTLEGSSDGVNWTTIASFTGGAFGNRTDTLTVSGSHRFVRINCTEKSAGNNWGYSIYDVRLTALLPTP
ncbi:discoidin domain-containing protein [Saccharophagus degradans]|uniref:Putative retaining b-glycosidase n=1 Tax=Saccharophagus degradans (strain 2-40 / ATCC 43961 / DSM 17024) TaxID=203122 RepID=Q21KS3_SACD2|nr:discoidin domain-containing protein [Saccharophagus degradans]ABD80706.1 putative retaining b-glycosidase [Saccharophagus degradans 2-40]